MLDPMTWYLSPSRSLQAGWSTSTSSRGSMLIDFCGLYLPSQNLRYILSTHLLYILSTARSINHSSIIIIIIHHYRSRITSPMILWCLPTSHVFSVYATTSLLRTSNNGLWMLSTLGLLAWSMPTTTGRMHHYSKTSMSTLDPEMRKRSINSTACYTSINRLIIIYECILCFDAA